LHIASHDLKKGRDDGAGCVDRNLVFRFAGQILTDAIKRGRKFPDRVFDASRMQETSVTTKVKTRTAHRKPAAKAAGVKLSVVKKQAAKKRKVVPLFVASPQARPLRKAARSPTKIAAAKAKAAPKIRAAAPAKKK